MKRYVIVIEERILHALEDGGKPHERTLAAQVRFVLRQAAFGVKE